MAYVVPTPSEIWRLCYNNPVGGTGVFNTDCQSFHYLLKQFLCGEVGTWLDIHGASASAPSNPGTVTYSSDASSVSASDLITSAPKLVASAAAHSWYSVTMPGVGANFEMLFDYYSNGGSYGATGNSQEVGAQPTVAGYGGWFLAQGGGFASGTGTTSRRAWAASETQVYHRSSMSYLSSNLYFNGLSTPWAGKLHVIQKSDSSAIRMILCISGNVAWYMQIEKPSNPFATNGTPSHTWNADEISWVGVVDTTYTTTNILSEANFMSSADRLTTRLASYTNNSANTPCALGFASLYSKRYADWVTSLNASSRSPGDNGYVYIPLWLTANASGYQEPIVGKIPDMYLVGGNLVQGSSGPQDATSAGNAWRVFGNMLHPAPWGVAVEMS